MIAALALVAACVEPAADGPQVCSRQVTAQFWGWLTNPLDVVIVVDRSPSMADDRARVMALQWMVAEVARIFDAHVAVVSSDLGGAGVPGCVGAGDDARFMRGPTCGLDGAYLRSGARADAGTRDNAAGSTQAATSASAALTRTAPRTGARPGRGRRRACPRPAPRYRPGTARCRCR